METVYYKVRMNEVKCTKFKTFQPESPTRKFIFSNEIQDIHNLKLLNEDTNKATTTTTTTVDAGKENVKSEEEQQPEEVRVRKAMTGMFRDNIRRIDLVLVVKDDVSELNNIKFDFLLYILRAGLEVEIEPGVMKNHKKLIFIKIHAPDSVLKNYGKFFGTKRYFADTRYDYMDVTNKKKTENYEKEWVMLVRNNYEISNGYSNYERSIIVYKILLHLSFGDNANYYGIERLLKGNVIIDVFALHDGPYFITPDETISGSNARQILNYYWSTIQNVFKQQPVHLIHEYFGPSLAFYFAFYEFTIKALKVAAFLGILNILVGMLNLTILEKVIKKSTCESTSVMCKFCDNEEICPRRVFKDYCLSVQIHLILDHIFIPLYSIFTVIGTFVFIRLWKRREYFLKWIWEVDRHDSYYKNIVRPLFDSGFGARPDLFIKGLKYSESIISISIRNVVSKAIVILYWYTIVPIMFKTYELYKAFCKEIITNRPYEKYRDYIVMSMFQIIYILLISGFEKIYHHIIYFIVKYENHISYKENEKSIVIKKFGFKMIFYYAFVAYYAWIHGHHPRYGRCSYPPTSLNTYSSLIHYMYLMYGYKESDVCENNTYCSPYSCIIETAILLGTLLVVTQVVYKMPAYVFSLRTDYNQSIYSNSDIPCWEREYRLSSWTEEDMVQKYVNLAVQATLVTWFVIAFPLAPLILYFVNVWHIRHEARKLLLASRRPLLLKTPGTKMNKVFYFIATVAVLTNAINIALTTRTGLRYMTADLKEQPDKLFSFTHYYYRRASCYAPDILKDGMQYRLHSFPRPQENYFYKLEFYILSVHRFCQIILFVFAMGCAFLIIRYIIPRQQEVERVRATEEKIRNLFYHYEYEYS